MAASTHKKEHSSLSWCLRQKKGVKMEEPNKNTRDGYFKKAESALNILGAAIEKEEIEWIATIAYYARYFAFYAVLQQCGIKSEIHDCTLALMKSLFLEKKYIEENYYYDIEESKKQRIDVQYYVAEEVDKEKIKRDAHKAKTFVLNMQEISEKLSKEQIQSIRNMLMDIQASHKQKEDTNTSKQEAFNAKNQIKKDKATPSSSPMDKNQ